MTFPPRKLIAPAEAPVAIAEAKAHLRVDHDDEDAVISAMVEAAVSYFDGYSGILGRCLVTQGWRQPLAHWPSSRRVVLPFPDVSEVLQITYLDSDGARQTLENGSYSLQEHVEGSVVRFGDDFSFPVLEGGNDQPVLIDFNAGYGAASEVPEAVKMAILLTIGQLFMHRGDDVRYAPDSAIPKSAEHLIGSFRRAGL